MTASATACSPLRIYMDQKDFSSIAAPFIRGDHSNPAMLAYEQLKTLVAADRVRIYLSAAHLVETLGYPDVTGARVAAHCEVVDTLTEGHCIRATPSLLAAELELALADLFGFSTAYSRDAYPYGKGAEAVTTSRLLIDPASLGLSPGQALSEIERLRRDFRTTRLNRHGARAFLSNPPPEALHRIRPLLPPGTSAKTFLKEIISGSEEDRRELATKVFATPTFMRGLIEALPDEAFDELNRRCPGRGFTWTRDVARAAFAGSPGQREAVLRDFFDGVMSFSQLVRHYSLTRPELMSLAHVFDSTASTWVTQIELLQRLEPLRLAVFGTPANWDRSLAKGFSTRYLVGWQETMRSLSAKYAFSFEVAEQRLGENDFARLPYIRAISAWMAAYLSKHKGPKSPRTPQANDLLDFLHCVSAPYVDILVMERFAGDLSKSLATAFGTQVVTSLTELRGLLPG